MKIDKSKMAVQGRSHAFKGINVIILYIESENGVPVDGDMINHIQNMAKSFWDGLGDNAPAT